MSSLTGAQLSHLRQILTAERTEVLASVSSLRRDAATLAASRSDGDNRVRSEGDGDAAAVEAHLVSLLDGRARAALGEIDDALARLAGGGYGVCAGCRQPIPFERLEVRPRTGTCVPCAGRR